MKITLKDSVTYRSSVKSVLKILPFNNVYYHLLGKKIF